MKKILITGGGHSELPIIESAKQLGFYVLTTGTNYEGIGHKEADKYVYGDFSDNDFVLKLAEDENVDGIISGCNDFAYLSAAYACEKLKLTGHDNFVTAELIHNKDKFRKFTRSIGIRTPQAERCIDLNAVKTACKKNGFPVVIKPVDLTGGKGVAICKSESEVIQKAENAFELSKKSYILVEEYIDGRNYGTSMILKNNRVICSVFGNEQYYFNKYLVSGACTAADLNDNTKEKLCADIEKISRSLNLCDGLFHTQFIVDKNGEPVIIDPCRRAPGDLYVKFAQYVTGVNFPEVIVRAETGMEFSQLIRGSSLRYIARMCIMTDKNGIIKRIIIPDAVQKKIVDSLIWAKSDEQIDDFMKYKAGILFIEENSPDKLYDLCENFYDMVKINVE